MDSCITGPAEAAEQGRKLLQERRYAEAEPLLRAASDRQPDDPRLLFDLGRCLHEGGKPVLAEQAFREVARRDPAFELAALFLAHAVKNQGRLAEALEILRQAVQANPRSADAHANLANVLLADDRRDEGVVHLRRVVALKPEWVDPCCRLVQELARRGEYVEAEGHVARMLKANPKDPQRRRVAAWLAAAAGLARLDMDGIANATEAAEFLLHQTIEKAVGPTRPSVFWGDRMLSLDKAMSFLAEPRFAAAFDQRNKGHRYTSFPTPHSVAWRVNTLVWAAREALKLPGDFVECGTFEGDMSWVVAQSVDFARVDKRFFLYDSFSGFTEEAIAEEKPEAASAFGHLQNVFHRDENLYQRVARRFAGFPNVRVIQGFLPGSLAQGSPEQISYLHVDLNGAEAEIAVLDALFDRVVRGGFVVFDDYGWLDFKEQKAAEDAWMARRGYSILELPTGQGLVVK